MRRTKFLVAAAAFGLSAAIATAAPAAARPRAATDFAVGPQYDTTHVYVAAADFDKFVASFVATFGGETSKQGQFQVTPTSSLTKSQLVLTPAGTISVFGFLTPVPYPFGAERTGYLVTDIDAAVKAARRNGAIRLIETFPDPIGRDIVVQWPGGVNMQLYWHTAKPNYAPLTSIPENRVYLTADAADEFIRRWTGFAHGRILSDEKSAPGSEVGQPDKTIRRVRIASGYGKLALLVSNGQLPWPWGRDLTGYEVNDLRATLAKAEAAGAKVVVQPYDAGDRHAALVEFPGGYIAEIHQARAR
ncbi:glyoxalase [Methylosinus sporium]|uniref:Glyoxalase n=1 Tax=Methylosinus sporium TaxID=428 RepID=A0A549T8R0_METSR|nr:glyoxalase [Methylosinus sporium]TRL38261.1 glyoxalase [Methylosinus sporium]